MHDKGVEFMWSKEVLGTDVYHLVACFHVYSMLGWLVESIYMSFCNKKLTNRGFAKGPFCPIYGFGAVIGNIILTPFAGNKIVLHLMGALIATTFEYMVGKLMQHVLGSIWWDYNEKPFNYKGIICLESTVAWGFYAIIVVGFLNNKIIETVNRMPLLTGIRLCEVILVVYLIDFTVAFAKAKGIDREEFHQIYENIQKRIGR